MPTYLSGQLLENVEPIPIFMADFKYFHYYYFFGFFSSSSVLAFNLFVSEIVIFTKLFFTLKAEELRAVARFSVK